MTMRVRVGVLTVVAVCWLGGPLQAGECPKEVAAAADRLRQAVEADKTPALVEEVVAKTAGVADLTKLLAPYPGQLEPTFTKAVGKAADLARRDGEKALAFALWLEALAHDVRKAAPKDVRTCRVLRDAYLLHGRVASALVVAVPATPWIKAADLVLECEELAGTSPPGDASWLQALAVLEEGTRGEKASVVALLDHAAVLCKRALKERGDSNAVRRAVAASYELQADTLHETSRKRTQRALQGYFEAFEPCATARRAQTKDRRAWNRRVSFARELKLDVKAGYVGRTGTGADRLMSYLLPDTGRWEIKKGAIRQRFPSDELFRIIWFDTYDWDTVYTLANSRRTVGGDNIKGIAGRNLDSTLNKCKKKKLKVTKTRKPKRTKLNKSLPAGIEYAVEYWDDDGLLTRERSFLVKAVKAEKTVQVIIIEAVALTEYDPEFEAILESLEITKKTR